MPYLRSDKAIPLLESAVANLNGNGPVSTIFPGILNPFLKQGSPEAAVNINSCQRVSNS